MKRLWPFRSFANFSLTVIATTGLGLFYYSVANERVFSNSPVVSQSLKYLGHNNTMKNLIGHPITYSGSFSNSHNIKEEQQYYNFQIKGSKTNTTAELNATRMKVKDINTKIQKANNLQELVKVKYYELVRKKEQIKNLKNKQKNLALSQIKNLQSELKNIQQQFKIANNDKITCLNKYYIPNDELYQTVIRNKSPQSPIDEQIYLYGIDGLTAKLPNNKTINIIPPEANNIDTKISDNNPKQFLQVKQITQGYLKSRIFTNSIEDLTESQLHSYGKHKTSLMYDKYNGYRMGISMVIIFGIGLLFSVLHKFRVRSVLGTVIAYEAQQRFLNNHKTIEILKGLKKKKQNVKFNKSFAGGRKDEKFAFSVGLDGVPGAKVIVEGRYLESDTKPIFNKLQFQYKEGKESKKADLLL